MSAAVCTLPDRRGKGEPELLGLGTRDFWHDLRLFLHECCLMWKLFSTFVLSRMRQTYGKCFRLVLIWKCGSFQ